MNVARRKKLKLFVTFVDFSRAYDCVPRSNLFMTLKRLGCGITMLLALAAMYKCTSSLLGTALIAATVGVRQGSPTSCILFMLYVNDMIQMIKQRCPLEGFLTWLHILVMMDDTVLLSTTRKGMNQKIEILHEFCNTHGMVINSSKTKFMVINGSNEDKQPMVYTFNNEVINYCNHYIYLGSPFTDDGSPSTAIRLHADNKMCHTLKFISFVNRNNDVPFIVKKKIFDAAVTSSMLYGCESWLNGDLKPVEKQYKWCLKQLLGVRKTTNNDVCMVELGIPPLRALVKAKQRIFFSKMYSERNEMNDDPLMHAVRVVLDYNDAMSRYINDLISCDTDDIADAIIKLKINVSNSVSNRLSFYKAINPELTTHDIYTKNVKVNEIERVSWTRLRVSAHSLAVERGRWNRRGRGRLPMEERLCPCGQIQTESHIIEQCHMSLHIRQVHGFSSVDELMVNRSDYGNVCNIVHKLLDLYYVFS